MRLRTFTAPDMQSAMKLVRESLGEEAIIISTQPQPGRKQVSVTAAVEMKEEEESPSRVIPLKQESARPSEALGNLRFDLQTILRFHNLPEHYIAKILQKASDKDMQSILAMHKIGGRASSAALEKLALEKLLSNFFAFEPLQYEATHRRIMLIGAPGIGKTLTAAKIAAKLAMEKLPLAVFTTDNKRAGGIEQLQAFTDILNVPLRVTATAKELAKELAGLHPHTHVVIDTAGCNPYDARELQELKSFADLEGVRPILVMQAGSDSLEAIDTAEAFTALPITRLLVTRADTARRFGGIIAAAAAHGLAFCNVSSSGSIAAGLDALNAGLLSEFLLQYKHPKHQEQYERA